VLLVIASQSFAINRQCDLKGRCGLDRGRLSGFRCAALLRTDQPVIHELPAQWPASISETTAKASEGMTASHPRPARQQPTVGQQWGWMD